MCSTSVISHRFVFRVNPNVEPTKATIHCTVERFLPALSDRNIQFTDSIPAGTAVSWVEGFKDRPIYASSTMDEFDCAVASHDSDLTIFEPHMKTFHDVFGRSRTDQVKALVARCTRKATRTKPASVLVDELDEGMEIPSKLLFGGHSGDVGVREDGGSLGAPHCPNSSVGAPFV